MKVLGIQGSPRRGGNTSLLLKEALEGARESGAEIEEIVLRDLKMSPCLEIYACKKDGRCVIKDDFIGVCDKLVDADRIFLASPIMFYTVSAHTKILMDRCQALWVKRYWLNQPVNPDKPDRRGYFLSIGATQGKLLFRGVLMTVKYFYDALDMSFDRKENTVLVRGVDDKGEILQQPEALRAARELGRKACRGAGEQGGMGEGR